MNSKLLCLLISLFLFTTSAYAQDLSLKGRVINAETQALSHISVFILATDSSRIADSQTDSTGVFSFEIPASDYILQFKQFGNILLEQALPLTESMDLGDIRVNESQMLEGVTIQGSRKLVEQKIDRLVYNVSNSIAAQGMTGLDALRNTPLIRVQDPDGVSIIGKGSVSFMINDRMLNLSGSELLNYLQSIRSDDILRIEVITTPPAKYEAEGNSGIINIILKTNVNTGFSGSVNGTVQKGKAFGTRSAASLNYQSNTFSSSLKLRQVNNEFISKNYRDIVADHAVSMEEDYREVWKHLGGNLNLEYKPNKKSTFGFIYDFANNKPHMDVFNSSSYLHLQQVDSVLLTTSKHNWETNVHTMNAYYEYKLDTLGKKLTFTGNYLKNSSDRNLNFKTTNAEKAEIVNNVSLLNYAIKSFQSDLSLPYSWANMEVGAKYTQLNNNSNVKYFNFIDPEYILNPNNSNAFNYKEENYAAYISFHKKLSEKWDAKAGLRYEYTALDGFNPDDSDNAFQRNYGQWFPSTYISYKMNDDHSLSLNYSRRINRPYFQALNPFRWYMNPYSYSSGNSELMPAFNNNFELNYAFKTRLTGSIYYQMANNKYSSIGRFEEGIFSNTFMNSFNDRILGINLGYYDTFFSIWETSINANFNRTRLLPIIEEITALKATSLSYSANNTVTLNKNKTVFMLLNFWHNLPFTFNNSHYKAMYGLNPGVRFSALDKKLQVSMVYNDVFNTVNNIGYTDYTNFREEFRRYFSQRQFVLTATYSFGNNKIKEVKKNTKFDDSSRAN